jgi:hypothetical protein
MSGHPWREPWSASPSAAGPRPWAQALERAIRRQHAAGTTVEELAQTLKLPEAKVREILREQEPKP